MEALCKTREFSEYMLYGYLVQNDARFAAGHTHTSSTPCISYWEQPKLSKEELNELLRRAGKDDVAFSIASFSGTPVDTIRAAIVENFAAGPSLVPHRIEGLAAAC